MRKWTYLVAALLMSGTAATFTSCIDTTEPAGIENLRGAKAELLQAKAQVQLAEAQKKLADAEYKKALAAIKQEKAKQQALRTALMAEKNEKKIAEIKQEMELSAAKHRQEMAIALAAAEDAEMKYQQTLVDIELALLGYKEDMYAQELQKLLSEQEFKYTTKKIVFEIDESSGNYQYDKKGNILYSIVDDDVYVTGYYSLLSELSDARKELADFNKQLINLSLRVDYTDLKKENDAMIAYYQGLIDADTELLAEYKRIGDLDITAWEAEYESLKANKEAANDKITEISDKLANDLLPLKETQRELNAKFSEEKEYTFTFDKGISEPVYNNIFRITYAPYFVYSNPEKADYIRNEIQAQLTRNEEGEYIFTDGLKLKLTLSEFGLILNGYEYYDYGTSSTIKVPGLYGLVEEKYNKWTAQEAYNSELELTKLEVNKNDAFNAYENERDDIWEPLHEDFIAKAKAYKYNYKAEAASEKYDSRNEIIKKLDEYNALTTEEKDDAANIKKYADEFAKYLKERYDLDGWNPEYNNTDPDNIIYYKDELANTDAAKQKAAFLAFIAIPDSDSDSNNYNELFGKPELTTTYNSKSTYSKLIASAKKIWGDKKYKATDNGGSITLDSNPFTNDELVVMVEFDMEEWLAQGVEAVKFLEGLYNDANYTNPVGEFDLTILGDGLANDRFASENLYNKANEDKIQHTNYEKFLAELDKLNEAYESEYNALYKDMAENDNAIADLEATAKQETAKWQREITGYDDVMKIMATVIGRNEGANDNVTATEASIEKALENIKNAIIDIEGGLKVTFEDEQEKTEYVYGTLVEYKAWQSYYDNINKGLEDGTYTVEGLYDGEKQALEDQIKIKEEEIQILDAMCNQASEKKDELLKVITGSTATE